MQNRQTWSRDAIPGLSLADVLVVGLQLAPVMRAVALVQSLASRVTALRPSAAEAFIRSSGRSPVLVIAADASLPRATVLDLCAMTPPGRCIVLGDATDRAADEATPNVATWSDGEPWVLLAAFILAALAEPTGSERSCA